MRELRDTAATGSQVLLRVRGAGQRSWLRPALPFTRESYTPKHLAEKILTSTARSKANAIMSLCWFVDVSGFTALSERLDPPDSI
jgi:hypothetical protein